MPSPKSQRASPRKNHFLCLIFIVLFFFYYYFHRHHLSPSTTTPTTLHHLIFGIASSSKTFIPRKDLIKLWYKPESTRAYVFVDQLNATFSHPNLPPILAYSNTSSFPYTFGDQQCRFAIRIARIVKQVVELNDKNVHWYVFGDDDTIFFTQNLVKTLSKYDHNGWYYIGSNSERYELNYHNSFNMAFGGGGFAISYPLAKVLASVLDSCLMRYPHLFGSDARIFSCLAELGVGLTHEVGFHQVDFVGDMFGMLSAHPLSPLVSLHHLGNMHPLFPNMKNIQAVNNLFKAVNVDAESVLQQSVCYDRLNSLTLSIAWGYAVQLFEGNHLLPDLLQVEKTFKDYDLGEAEGVNYMFKTREHPKDPCKRPIVFFFQSILSDQKGIWTDYIRHDSFLNCSRNIVTRDIERIRVFSQKSNFDTPQVTPPRRKCCDISPFISQSMTTGLRECNSDELISMHK